MKTSATRIPPLASTTLFTLVTLSGLVVLGLSAQPASAADAVEAVATKNAPAIDATTLWTKNCKSCHGEDGKGKTKAGSKLHVQDLTAPEVVAKFCREDMIKAVTEGLKDEKTGKTRMKSYAEKLSAAEISATVDYVLSLTK